MGGRPVARHPGEDKRFSVQLVCPGAGTVVVELRGDHLGDVFVFVVEGGTPPERQT